MTSVWIVRRVKVEDGRWIHSAKRRPARRGDVRWVVWYRLGRGGARMRYAGSFRTREEAERRERLVGGLIAEGRGREIPAMLAQAESGRTLEALVDEALALTPAPSAAQVKRFRQARAQLGELREVDVEDVTRADVQRWVNELSTRYSAATVHQYLGVVRQALDQADLGRPNPARDRRLRLPVIERDEEFQPPSWDEFRAILDEVADKYRDLLVVIEGTGLRISEAVRVAWGDLDLAGGRLRVSAGRTKGRTGGRRFVPLTEDVRAAILRQPYAEGGAAPIFAGLTDHGARGAMREACRRAGVPHFHPHDLRGRWISLCLIAGIPVEMVRTMAGHRKTSMTLDVYSHVVLSEPRERLVELRRAVSLMFGISPQELPGEVPPAQRGGEMRMEDTGLEPLDP